MLRRLTNVRDRRDRALPKSADTRQTLSPGVSARPYHSAVRLKLYLAAAAVAGTAAFLVGAGPIWSLAIGVLAPMFVAAAPSFLHGTFAGLRTAKDPAAEMSG